jgi:hypothetical protein
MEIFHEEKEKTLRLHIGSKLKPKSYNGMKSLPSGQAA